MGIENPENNDLFNNCTPNTDACCKPQEIRQVPQLSEEWSFSWFFLKEHSLF